MVNSSETVVTGKPKVLLFTVPVCVQSEYSVRVEANKFHILWLTVDPNKMDPSLYIVHITTMGKNLSERKGKKLGSKILESLFTTIRHLCLFQKNKLKGEVSHITITSTFSLSGP